MTSPTEACSAGKAIDVDLSLELERGADGRARVLGRRVFGTE